MNTRTIAAKALVNERASMKSFFTSVMLIVSFLSVSTYAQRVDVKDLSTSEEDTTIQIKKGKMAPNEIRYEVISSDEDIEADASPLLKDARDNWKKACADWKKETKETNKENQIISMSCGSMDCATVAMESTCRSKAVRKVRVRMTE